MAKTKQLKHAFVQADNLDDKKLAKEKVSKKAKPKADKKKSGEKAKGKASKKK